MQVQAERVSTQSYAYIHRCKHHPTSGNPKLGVQRDANVDPLLAFALRFQVFPLGAWHPNEYKLARNSAGLLPVGPQGAFFSQLKGPRAQAAGRQLCIAPDNPSGVPEMLPCFLSKSEHINASTQLISLYQQLPCLADYLKFAVEHTVHLGASAQVHPGPEATAIAWAIKADAETRRHWVHFCRSPTPPYSW